MIHNHDNKMKEIFKNVGLRENSDKSDIRDDITTMSEAQNQLSKIKDLLVNFNMIMHGINNNLNLYNISFRGSKDIERVVSDYERQLISGQRIAKQKMDSLK
jgi:hypothetical protein